MYQRRRLYRSRREAIIAGVAGGIAEYLEADPTIVRLVWLIAACMGGVGILIYFVAWLIMPLNPEGPYNPRVEKTEEWRESVIQAARDVEEKLKGNGDEGRREEYTAEWRPVGSDAGAYSSRQRTALVLGWALVVIGILFLVFRLSPISMARFFWLFWPVALIALGAILVVRGMRR